MNIKQRICQMLGRIEESIELIQSQTGKINKADDFLQSQEGMFILSGICMQLIYIGENVKAIDAKTHHNYLIKYPQIPWSDIMGLRDIIAHEYHRIDEEEIFNVITKDLPKLAKAINQMKSDLGTNHY